MSKITSSKASKSSKASVKAVKDWKVAAPRTQIYIKALMRKHGASAKGLKDAVNASDLERRAEGFTSHNSYSLQLLATTYGFRFWSEQYTDGKHYFFASVHNDPKLAAKAAADKATKQASKPATAPRIKLPLVAHTDDAAMQAKALKASRVPRKQADTSACA